MGTTERLLRFEIEMEITSKTATISIVQFETTWNVEVENA